MALKTRIWLTLAALMLLVLGVDLSFSYRKLTEEVRAETSHDARTIYAMMMAMRRVYQAQFVESEIALTPKTVGFLPAHSLSRIARDFGNWSQSGIVFNNVSDRPRNPVNQADGDELDAMAWFRAHPEAEEHMAPIENGRGERFLLYTAPIRIEPSCLKCHGRADEAPPGIREHYAASYGYQVGDLRGVVSIRLPMAKFEARIWGLWTGQLLKTLLGYAVLFVAVGLLLERLVMRRLQAIEAGAQTLAAGHYNVRVPAVPDDEIGRLGQVFNAMAEKVADREAALTRLSQAIEQSPQSVVITDLDGRIEYVNRFFLEHTGYTRAEVIGENSRLLQSGLTPAAVVASLWDSLRAGQVWHGEFINRRKDGSEYHESATVAPVRDAEGRITHYLAVKQDLTERRAAEATIHRLAYFDEVTGLPNRALLLDRLEQSMALAMRQGRPLALIICNLDRFRHFNDVRGQAQGDALLRAVGERLGRVLREGETLARLGADEFALLLPDLDRQQTQASLRVQTLAEAILAQVRQPLRLDAADAEVNLDASLGITLCPHTADDTPGEALRRADTALHRAKAGGGGQLAFFDPRMGEQAEQRLAIETDLRRALSANELQLYLQPQVDAAGRCHGAEVLVRWQHPQQGLIMPGIFIPVAEESDLIVALGVWVFEAACRLQVRLAAAGVQRTLSVNLSPRHFRQADFVVWVEQALRHSGADPTQLVLEITEGLVIDDVDAVVTRMRQLTALGIRFSIDDFGTGYSSLAYLKRLPIHELKIDRGFVQGLPDDADDAALIETILAVASHLRLQVVAEGVETRAQADFLNAHGPVIHQGYLLGRPEPAEVWISRWQDA